MAPEFFQRMLFLLTRRPRLGLPITLASIVAILHVHFLHRPGTGLESFLAEGTGQESNPVRDGEGRFIPHSYYVSRRRKDTS